MSAEARPLSERIKLGLVTVLCLAAAGGGCHLLYLDLTQTGLEGEGAPVATLERKESSVRRRPSRSFVWSNINLKEQFYRKDAIQTGPQSIALVTLQDGSSMELGENSLIVFDDNSDLPFSFEKGTAVIIRADGTEAQLQVEASGSGPVQAQEIAVRLSEPKTLSVFYTQGNRERDLHFAWKSNAPLPGAMLEISKDRDFNSKSLTRRIAFSAPNLSEAHEPLTPGKYFWRIVSADFKALSRIAQFEVKAVEALQALSPYAAEKFQRWSSEDPVTFVYQAGPGTPIDSGKHELQIAHDAAFTQSLRKQSIEAATGRVVIPALPDGDYFWRLVSQYGDLTLPSEPRSLRVAQRSELKLIGSRPRAQESFGVGSNVPFQWSAAGDQLEYQLEILAASGTKIADQNLKGVDWNTRTLPVGKYRWRVSALYRGKSKGQSEWSEFHVMAGNPLALKLPEDERSFRFWKAPESVDFAWEPVALNGGEIFHFEIASDSRFEKVLVSEKLRVPSVTLSSSRIGQETHYWRVKVLSSDAVILRSSMPRSFTWQSFPLLAAPGGRSPASAEEFDVVHGKDPLLKWELVEEAQSYVVSVFKGQADSSSPVLFKKYKATKNLLLLKEFASGDYSWSVASVDPAGRTGPDSPLHHFKVTYGKILSAPKAETPEVQ